MTEYHKIQSIFKRDPNNNMQIMLGVYSLPEFEYLKDNQWVFTEKVDGTNVRVIWDGASVTFGGKTDNAQIPAVLVTVLNNMFMTIEKRQLLKEMFNDPNGEPPQVCLYGEGYGASIQSGGNYISTGVDFILFDVKVGDWWLQRENVEEIATKLGLKVVPIIGEGTLEEMVEKTRQGFDSIWGSFIAEGIVARPKTEFKTRHGERIITKIKHKDFK